MLKFELAYSLLYKNNITCALKSPEDLFTERLQLESAQILYDRLSKPHLITSVTESINIINKELINKPLSLSSALSLLNFELCVRQAPHNCFIWQGNLHSDLTGTIIKTVISSKELDSDNVSNLILSHGLRWGWTIAESIGRNLIVNAEKQVLIDRSGCSCELVNCDHVIFAEAVRKQRSKLSFCIKLSDSKLI